MVDPHDYTLSRRAIRDLESLPEGVAAACAEFIAGPLAENPRRLGKPLLGRWAGAWSARRGTYRVIYEIDEQRRRVRVIHIGHRGSVYLT